MLTLSNPVLRGVDLIPASKDFDYYTTLERACEGDGPFDLQASVFDIQKITCKSGIEVEKVGYVVIPDDTGPVIAYAYRRRFAGNCQPPLLRVKAWTSPALLPAVFYYQIEKFTELKTEDELRQWEQDMADKVGLKVEGSILSGTSCESISGGIKDDCDRD